MARKVGAPLAVVIGVGILAGASLALAGLASPLLFAVGLLPTLVVFAGAVFAYTWLDRWEPEPRRLLVFAFLWGAGVAIVGALIVGFIVARVFGIDDPVLGAVVQAPLVEEALKGLFLVLMVTGRRRAEVNTLTDLLVYAGFVGLGFAFVEDLLYMVATGSIVGTIVVAALRLILGVFAHPFFTSATAIGIHVALRATNPAVKALAVIGGYVVAVLLHAVWNGAATLGGFGVYLLVYGAVLVPLFAGLVVIAVRSRNSEGRIVQEQVPQLAAEGLIHPAEAGWLMGTSSRRDRYRKVKTVAGRKAANQVRHFADVATELSFVRDRIARGQGTAHTQQQAAELAAALAVERELALPHLVAVQQLEGSQRPSMPSPPSQAPPAAEPRRAMPGPPMESAPPAPRQ